MKLVDILARELKEWPGNDAFDYCLLSSENLTVLFKSWATPIEISSRPDDCLDLKVTRAQWQAAVDALKAVDQPWEGEGLPPVRAKVRIGNFPGNKWLENFQGREAMIIAHDVTKSGEASAVFKTFANNGYPRYHALAYEEGNFLPIRTAEQIAAEEREAGISALMCWASQSDHRGYNLFQPFWANLYDRGMRVPK